jgi:NAD(P)H-hydrate epimerase
MEQHLFQTAQGKPVPALTAQEMREVDRIAVEEFGLGILQMMENAGRTLAAHVLELLRGQPAAVAVLAGPGGNGGGGLCCARHLHNRGIEVRVVLSKDETWLHGPTQNQLHILQRAGLLPLPFAQGAEAIRRSSVVVDALLGYSLHGAPRGPVAELIALCNQNASQVISLDVPSGLDATTGEAPGRVVRPQRTLTLALPKTGLRRATGEIYLADIGIPPQVYLGLGLVLQSPFEDRYWVALERCASSRVPDVAPPPAR